jgi:hypothetical protein
MRIAFYAPLKSPDHPVPSGDRLLARLLVDALRGACSRAAATPTGNRASRRQAQGWRSG